MTLFQFTRPRGARRFRFRTGWQMCYGFNSRAREGRDLLAPTDWIGGSVVSIHAPARGATGIDAISKALVALFQFTRPRGARLAIKNNQIRAGWGFNSRAREGRDRAFFKMFAWMSLFQFTRPRGARPRKACTDEAKKKFQFTRPRGARHGSYNAPTADKLFQFTRPRGARR